MTTPCCAYHRIEQIDPHGIWQLGITQAFQRVEIHPVSCIDRQWYAKGLVQADLTATQSGIVLDIIDDQRTCMEALDRIADRRGHRSNSTGHLITQLQQ
jgi:hypothetical protein